MASASEEGSVQEVHSDKQCPVGTLPPSFALYQAFCTPLPVLAHMVTWIKEQCKLSWGIKAKRHKTNGQKMSSMPTVIYLWSQDSSQ
jgi:hypothetical protein